MCTWLNFSCYYITRCAVFNTIMLCVTWCVFLYTQRIWYLHGIVTANSPEPVCSMYVPTGTEISINVHLSRYIQNRSYWNCCNPKSAIIYQWASPDKAGLAKCINYRLAQYLFGSFYTLRNALADFHHNKPGHDLPMIVKVSALFMPD